MFLCTYTYVGGYVCLFVYVYFNSSNWPSIYVTYQFFPNEDTIFYSNPVLLLEMKHEKDIQIKNSQYTLVWLHKDYVWKWFTNFEPLVSKIYLRYDWSPCGVRTKTTGVTDGEETQHVTGRVERLEIYNLTGSRVRTFDTKESVVNKGCVTVG